MSNPAKKRALLPLTLGSVGVVYGDIGTSPLYAFRESLAAAAGLGNMPTAEIVIGVLSLILWTLVTIVTLKYVAVILHADNQGEGGILSLMALARKAMGSQVQWILLLGIIGAALFYGDAIITPAISVLSAVEGLKLITPDFTPYILSFSMVIMVALFALQRFGTAKVSVLFAPIMVVWFVAMGWGGFLHAQDSPLVWQALNPYHAVQFMLHHGFAALIALGAVFLAVTGAEALYADLGHFGKKPIRLAWIFLVMPSLMLNYVGQAALVLANPHTAEQSFFLLYPQEFLAPMVILATFATIIASQAVITGAFSLTHQAVQLGILPRLRVLFTSKDERGQIYMPQVNMILLVGVLVLIEVFRSSSALASAYGIAVTGTMIITSVLAFVVMRKYWGWSTLRASALMAPIFVLECVFFAANLTKFFEGGFMPVGLSVVLIIMMATWVRGCKTLHEQTREYQYSMEYLINQIRRDPPQRVDGTAIYLTSNPAFAPSALLQNLKHNKVLHEHNILLTICTESTPYVDDAARLTIEPLEEEFTRVTLKVGYMEQPNLTKAITLMRHYGKLTFSMMNISFFISRRTIMPSAKFGMPLWRDKIFITMANSATDAANYFHLPISRVVELGVQMTV